MAFRPHLAMGLAFTEKNQEPPGGPYRPPEAILNPFPSLAHLSPEAEICYVLR